MASYVLWALDNETAPRQFERLCTDLLSREGYPRIVPVGGVHDRGRDAEDAGCATDSERRTFFQFSLQEDWERKLSAELQKVRENGHEITDFVFVSSRSISGAARDRWTSRVRDEYGWQLRVFEREWFRHRLEGASADLAERYLGLPPVASERPQVAAPTESYPANGVAERQNGESPWTHMNAGRYREAVTAFHQLLTRSPSRADAWAGLAWSEYQLFHYDDARTASAEAIALEPTNPQWRSVRACILTEDGIRSGSRASVIEGSRLFAGLAEGSAHWVDHYNYANALSALNDHGAALREYRTAVDLDASRPEVWKNLASSLHHVGQHEEEMVCLDRALALDPNHPQALMSKGVSMLVDRHDPRAAVDLIEQVRQVAPSLFNRWPSAWNWLAQAYVAQQDLNTALGRVREGISAVPGDESLRHLEGSILHQLWPANPRLVPDAIRTNEFLSGVHPDEYGYVAELASLRAASGDDAAAWDVLVGWYERQSLGSGRQLPRLGLKLQDVRRALQFLPQYITFRGYRPIASYLAKTEEADATQSVAADLPEVESALYLGFAVAFGLAFDVMDRAERRRPRATALKAMRESQRVVVRTIPYAFAVLAESLGTGDASTEQRVNLVVEGVTRAPLAGLLEMAGLFGWMIALTGVPLSEGDMDQVAARLDYSGMQGKLLEETLVQMNDVLGLLPRE